MVKSRQISLLTVTGKKMYCFMRNAHQQKHAYLLDPIIIRYYYSAYTLRL